MAYDKEIVFKSIISQIEEGASLRSVLRQEAMPNSVTFYKWIDDDEEKIKHYARACEKRAESIFEDILEIADNASGDKKYTESGEIMDSEYVARSRIRIDARKWMLGKMQPKKYSDKTILSNDEDNPINFSILNIDPLSDANDNGST
jgi:hypothetical protein